MIDNTTITNNGAEVYTNNIYYYADEYINRLPNKEYIYKSDSDQFTGMIKYINKCIKFDRDILSDINILNDIWEIYTDLVYIYNQKPTIGEFAILIGVHRDTIYSWNNGETRQDYCEKLSTTRSDTVKKWQEECKLGRYKSAARGNVGGIFLCKAVDGMAETAPVQTAQQALPQPDTALPRLGASKGAQFVQVAQIGEDENA